MYFSEDRIRAVELYIKLGKRTSPTIRQLGYPTMNALKGWFHECQQRLGLPVDYARREPEFSQAQKAAAIEHYLTHVDVSLPPCHRCYGYRRLQPSLSRQDMTISEKVMQRLMKQESLVIAKPKRRRYASYLGEISPAPETISSRDFLAAAPNEQWLTDITEVQIPSGKVYLSPIIDCFGELDHWHES